MKSLPYTVPYRTVPTMYFRYRTVPGTDFHGMAYLLYEMNFTRIPEDSGVFWHYPILYTKITRLSRVLEDQIRFENARYRY